MERKSVEEKKRILDNQIDILFIVFSIIILFFGFVPFIIYYMKYIINKEVIVGYYVFRIVRDSILFVTILVSLFFRFVLKKKVIMQALFSIVYYLYMFLLVYVVKINYAIPFFAIIAIILMIQLIDINNTFKASILGLTIVLYITIGLLQLTGIVTMSQYENTNFDYFTLILNSIHFTVFLIATYLLNLKTQVQVEEKFEEIVDEKIETIGQLNKRLENQHKEVDFMNTAKAGFGNTMIAIQQENAKLYNYLIKNKQKLKYEDIYLYSYKIKDTLTKFIDTLAPDQVRKGLIDYDLVLDKPNYTLLITKSGNTYKVPLSETFLNIIEELLQILIKDIKNNVMNDRGYTDKIDFEKKLFQGITDANRLNSNVTRIRKELRNLGLDPKLIETKHHRIRLNTVSNNVEIID